jgi:hypothetical protein
MKAGDLTIEVRVVDYATAELSRIAWAVQAIDGQWHPRYLRADGLRQPVGSEVEAALVAVERNRR